MKETYFIYLVPRFEIFKLCINKVWKFSKKKERMFKTIILQTYNNMRFLCQHQSLRHHINSSNNHSCKQIGVISGHGHQKVTN